MNAIEVRSLHKRYNDNEAVCGIDLSVETGECFAFLGPNGAGKTTTVEILEGYRSRTSGEVSVLGMDPVSGGRELRNRVGIVLQECGFPRFSTVLELVHTHAGYYPHPRDAKEVLEIVGLTNKSSEVIKKLSGGQRRRLDLALAVVGDPDLIFLDEPTTGFDPNARRGAWDLVSNLKSLGKTIFLTTHYMDEAQHLADRVAVISSGRIVAQGTPESLGGRGSEASQITFGVAAHVQLPDLGDAVVNMTNGVAHVSTHQPAQTLNALTAWALQHSFDLGDISVTKPSLEDVYLKLTEDRS